MSILKEQSFLNEESGKMVTKTTYDNTAVLELNKAQRNEKTDGEQYTGTLAHVARIDMGDIIRLKSLGYNLLSSDPEEVRRALCYVQSDEPHLMTVNSKPFAMHRNKWA